MADVTVIFNCGAASEKWVAVPGKPITLPIEDAQAYIENGTCKVVKDETNNAKDKKEKTTIKPYTRKAVK